jgi:putative methyltransferase (TIGR04325 family)
MNAPIALFVYARPDHTRRTVQALLNNPEASGSDLIVYSDAARTHDKEEAVQRVRKYVSGIQGFRSLTVYYRQQNYGLAQSIIEGVTHVLEYYERVIVLEDDLETSPYFLRYMNEALDLFAKEERVISVHGYVYPVHTPLPEAFFLRGADCWGWATWRRGWAEFNPDGKFLLHELKRQNLLPLFDYNGAYSYSGMLEGQINGSNDSWAVRWHASAFLSNKLTLYPGRSLSHNIGNDSTGTHCGTSTTFHSKLSATPIRLDAVIVEESEAARKTIEDFFRAMRPPLQRVLGRFMTEILRQKLMDMAKDWLPPVLVRQLRRLSPQEGGITFEGPFATWDEAAKHAKGYDDAHILEKVLAATLKVKCGEAVFERDSVLFGDIQYAWPTTAGLFWAAAREDGRLNVLDFGGSLGSSFFQNRKFLDGLSNVRWSIVEQAHFVQAGRQHIHDERLAFYPTIAECVAQERPNVVLLSSVLHYLKEPYLVMHELACCGADLVVIDLTIVNKDFADRIFLQHSPKSIYQASYPVYTLSENRLIKRMNILNYRLIESFSSINFSALDTIKSHFNGYIFIRYSK